MPEARIWGRLPGRVGPARPGWGRPPARDRAGAWSRPAASTRRRARLLWQGGAVRRRARAGPEPASGPARRRSLARAGQPPRARARRPARASDPPGHPSRRFCQELSRNPGQSMPEARIGRLRRLGRRARRRRPGRLRRMGRRGQLRPLGPLGRRARRRPRPASRRHPARHRAGAWRRRGVPHRGWRGAVRAQARAGPEPALSSAVRPGRAAGAARRRAVSAVPASSASGRRWPGRAPARPLGPGRPARPRPKAR